MNKYPLPLQNAKEAKILQNFGDGICRLLDQRLQRYYRENGKKRRDGASASYTYKTQRKTSESQSVVAYRV